MASGMVAVGLAVGLGVAVAGSDVGAVVGARATTAGSQQGQDDQQKDEFRSHRISPEKDASILPDIKASERLSRRSDMRGK